MDPEELKAALFAAIQTMTPGEKAQMVTLMSADGGRRQELFAALVELEKRTAAAHSAVAARLQAFRQSLDGDPLPDAVPSWATLTEVFAQAE